ncbi:MAG: hypothetical protein IMZ57_11815 [Acidobacteria bacterium]|nr:hypothetical protein [Acidobacteriota bacterium]
MKQRRRIAWTEHILRKLHAAQAVIEELREFHPLTLRAIHYRLVATEFYENTMSEYTMLGQCLKWARLDGLVSWDVIEDRNRILRDYSGWESAEPFVEAHRKRFLAGYRRDVFHAQQTRCEVWTEKDAVSNIIGPICKNYTVPLVICRGEISVSFLHDYAERVAGYDEGAVLFYIGDFDPSGCAMDKDIQTSLRDEHHVDVEFHRIALTREDIDRYQLPHKPTAAKRSDPRYESHVLEHGEVAVELDALHPKVLQEKVQAAIEGIILDRPQYERQVKKERADLARLKKLKGRVLSFMDESGRRP